MKSEFQSIFSLKGNDVWVIGAAGYLGQATVKMLQEAGASVLCIDIEDRADKFIDTLPDHDNLSPMSLNTRDTAHALEIVNEQMATRGIPDGLVDLSYGSTSKSFDELTADDFDGVNHDGLTATFIVARAIGNAMKEKGRGSIVLFSSMYGSVSPYPEVYQAPMTVNPIEYGVGKAGIIQMTRYMAVHFGKDNVRCNCISPGPFPNPSVQRDNPEFVDRLCKKVPMGRVGESAEIAGAVIFLLSNAASYITGQNLFVDGGWTCW